MPAQKPLNEAVSIKIAPIRNEEHCSIKSAKFLRWQVGAIKRLVSSKISLSPKLAKASPYMPLFYLEHFTVI